MKTWIVGTLLIISSLFSCKHEPDDFTQSGKLLCDTNDVIPNESAIEGYSDKESYLPGETIEFKIHSLSPLHSLEIARYGIQTEVVHTNQNVKGFQQNYHCYSYSYGCNWITTYSVKIPETWKTGIYSVKLTNNNNQKSNYITFIIRKPSTQTEDNIAVIASTNTWQAYNDWGGGSFYDFAMDENVIGSTNLSFRRPNKYADPTARGGHLAASELYLLRWLEKEGYSYDQICDRDLHRESEILSKYKVVVMQSHPEYYTKEMYDRLYRYVQTGGHLIYLGGNAIWGKVTINRDKNILEIRRGDKHSDKSPGGLWRELGFPESGLMGVQYSESGYLTWKPYAVRAPGHWVFAGTGLKINDTFGSDCPDTGGASGHETDKMTPASVNISGIQLLAKGTNPDNGGADMVYYETVSGGKVFSVGSISFTSCLLSDSMTSKITRNVFQNFLQ
jgi:hypothetical protein